MEKYDYRRAVIADVKEWLRENKDEIPEFPDSDQLKEHLRETLWVADSVTGNASGSYTFSTWKAKENLCHNLDLLAEACYAYDEAMDFDPERMDVLIRLYLLGECIDAALEEMEADGEHLRD